MEKIKKIALIMLIWLTTIFIISVLQVRPIPVLLTNASIFQIPMVFWLVLMVTPFLLYIIARNSKNPFIPILCVTMYYFLAFSYGLYFMSHPTTGDIQSVTQEQVIVSSINHINPQEIDTNYFTSTARYFGWPIFFIFSKIFSCFLAIGPIMTINLGFFSLFLIMPLILTLYYKRLKNNELLMIYFIFPALYLILGFHFINSQFVPQFLGLIYLFILFGFYLKYRQAKNPTLLLLIIIFYSLLVFTHSFMFIFFLVAIIFEIYWSEYVEMERNKFLSYSLLIIFIAILYPFLGDFYRLATIPQGGESWRIFQSLFSQRNPLESGYQLQPLFYLVPKIYDVIFSNIVRIIIGIAFITVAIGTFFYLFKKRKLFDLSIIIGSASWFLLGLSNLVLGQRALQVVALPLSRHFKNRYKIFKHLSKVLIVIILIAPTLFLVNSQINSSTEGGRLIQDYEENIAGRFIDKHFINESFVICAQNPFPTSYPNGFIRDTLEFVISREEDDQEKYDFILYSPKLQKRITYLNFLVSMDSHDSILYNNEDIAIYYDEGIEINIIK
jgi:hypothetical protein